MKKLIAAFPTNISDALIAASSMKYKSPKHEIRNVIAIGMGGSGIGAKIVSQWVQDEIKVPILLVQDYTLPKFVDQHTLVIASSYSGNTEETLISVNQAKDQGAHIVAICSGGKLESFCKENAYDYALVPGGNPPRSAIAFSMVHIISILTKLNLISSTKLTQIEKSVQIILDNIDTIKVVAKRLADFLQNKIGVFYSIGDYEALMVRARQQFNENSKYLCWHHFIPEMNHNEQVGWGGGSDDLAVVFFDTKDYNQQNNIRFDITIERVKKMTTNVMLVESIGSNIVERTMYLIHLIDWASLYLSELNKVDIMDIQVIEFLKSELSKLDDK